MSGLPPPSDVPAVICNCPGKRTLDVRFTPVISMGRRNTLSYEERWRVDIQIGQMIGFYFEFLRFCVFYFHYLSKNFLTTELFFENGVLSFHQLMVIL